MEAETKKITLLIVAALVVVTLVFAVIFYFRSSGGSENNETNETTVTPNALEQRAAPTVVEEVAPEQLVQQQTPPEDSKEAQLKRVSIDFAARFGTYSSDAQAENLKQLLPQLSGDLKQWAEKNIAAAVTVSADSFTAVTTVALSAKIISQSTSKAMVEVSTQRTYVNGTDARVVYETATLSLVKSGSWQVESVTWAPRAQ
ncbi:MAG: hypothetical protein A2848_02615 [Candidatus Magasanikbacteria bacterium RIFCSPHIGHO2_01_FULL_50_8]|uniref:Tim44-like domain-containing protein n=1 Tax=Candidatus Magasanikbacteria bacterium RIFCSPHIGHO2_01_FULL_50_8 TaxID=1798674 RepID=A0A1F6LVQ4_9BACT|nr:MAG: hypothetical protein A2848_02615 [Candidatus Magasanikbacteria bacterium RIFCSPHIGHO2_01_FULL_50_8]